MHILQDKIDEILNKHQSKTVQIEKVQLIPYDEKGALLNCFTPLHVCYPDGYQYNLKKLGDHLKVACWGSDAYLHQYKHLRKDAKIESRHDCNGCDFCLEKASGYRLLITIKESGVIITDKAKLEKALLPFIKKVDKVLNAPVIDCSVNYEVTIVADKPIEYVSAKIVIGEEEKK